jgi:predicted nucleic acid-binding protein
VISDCRRPTRSASGQPYVVAFSSTLSRDTTRDPRNGLTIYESSPAEDLAALTFTKKAAAQFQLDFDDALHYATAKKHNLALVTFDRDFDRTDLTRAAPADILSRYG